MMKNRKTTVIFLAILLSIIAIFLICKIIYNHYYKIDLANYTYSFYSRAVQSPDKKHSISIIIHKTTQDSDTAYIMGILGASDNNGGYTKGTRTIFWQKVNSNSIKDKTINNVLLSNWIDVTWLDLQTVQINGITLNINNTYDYRRK